MWDSSANETYKVTRGELDQANMIHPTLDTMVRWKQDHFDQAAMAATINGFDAWDAQDGTSKDRSWAKISVLC